LPQLPEQILVRSVPVQGDYRFGEPAPHRRWTQGQVLLSWSVGVPLAEGLLFWLRSAIVGVLLAEGLLAGVHAQTIVGAQAEDDKPEADLQDEAAHIPESPDLLAVARCSVL
jgi:hypothetical protein